MRPNSGFTLLELTVSTCIMTLVMTVLMMLGLSMSRSMAVQDAHSGAESEALNGMIRLVREVRLAASASINWGDLPSTTLRFRTPTDMDGNTAPVDIGGFVELGPSVTVGPDTQDLNGDGLTDTQLIWTDGNDVRVLANSLANEDINRNGTLDTGEDLDQDGNLDTGVLFEHTDEGLRVTLRTARRTSPNTPRMFAQFSEIVVPRNGG